MLSLIKKTLSFTFVMGLFFVGAVMAPMEANARTDVTVFATIGTPSVVVAPPVVPLVVARPVRDPAYVPSVMPVISTDVQPVARWDGYRGPRDFRVPHHNYHQHWNAPRGHQGPDWRHNHWYGGHNGYWGHRPVEYRSWDRRGDTNRWDRSDFNMPRNHGGYERNVRQAGWDRDNDRGGHQGRPDHDDRRSGPSDRPAWAR